MRYIGEEFQFVFRQLVFYCDAGAQCVEIPYDTETEIAGYCD